MTYSMQILIAATSVALPSGLVIAWLLRTRAARRWQAFLDAFADREIDRQEHRQPFEHPRPRVARGGLRPSHRLSR